MDLITKKIENKIGELIISPLLKSENIKTEEGVLKIYRLLYNSIPDKKRISCGNFTIVKIISEYLYKRLSENNNEIFDLTVNMFHKSVNPKCRGIFLSILSFIGLNDYKSVLPFFEEAAGSDDWFLREYSQALFRKIIKKYPDEIKTYFLKLVKSDNDNIRRFVGESLRPCIENKWFYKNPDYPLSILKHLYKEKAPYPRTSAGNNLSDLARRQPDLVFKIVDELVKSGDKNSYWIAYRACRNLVKKEPLKVMDLLRVDEYKYKKRIHKRSDYV